MEVYMSYNFEKKMSTDARKAANTTFGLIGALIGLAFGGRSSGRVTRHRPSGFSRRRRW
jgi:hypothetical protein